MMQVRVFIGIEDIEEKRTDGKLHETCLLVNEDVED